MKTKDPSRDWQDLTFMITLGILGASFIHISFALIGLLCYLGPIYLYLRHHDKTWCQKYCPRASFLSKGLNKISLHLKQPLWLKSKDIKTFFVVYVGLNFLFATMSTLAVATGKIEPLDHVRLFMFYKVPLVLPQLIDIDLPMFIIHFSYRILSMLSSTLIIGCGLGFLYAPRIWCTICPVNTLSVPKKLKKQ